MFSVKNNNCVNNVMSLMHVTSVWLFACFFLFCVCLMFVLVFCERMKSQISLGSRHIIENWFVNVYFHSTGNS